MVAHLPDDWIVEALGGQGQLIRVLHAGRSLPWGEVTSKHSFPLLKAVHDTPYRLSILQVSGDPWK